MAEELIAPITEDLRADDTRMNIVKGLDRVQSGTDDVPFGASIEAEAGDWMVKDDTGVLVAPTATAVPNTYPVWVGNDQFDAKATGKGTIIVSGGYIYRTSKFVSASYSVGDNLTVKDLGGGERVPSAAGGADPILARVYSVPVDGVMEILVLNR